MRMITATAGLVLALTACSAGVDTDARTAPSPGRSTPTKAAPTTPTATPTAAPTPSERPALLHDGAVTPGRYRYVMLDSCDPAMGCSVRPRSPLPDVMLTVPAGWVASNEFHLVERDTPAGTGGPDGAGLVMGWTSYWASLNSQPCSKVSHQKPDIEVGPTVGDFVDAVVAHPKLDVTKPRPVRLGGHRGQFLTLTGPSDISGCEEWRPWEPSPYLQGPGNRWDLWVMDVGGTRMVIMAGYYPDTPVETRAELRAMAESVRFVPGRA